MPGKRYPFGLTVPTKTESITVLAVRLRPRPSSAGAQARVLELSGQLKAKKISRREYEREYEELRQRIRRSGRNDFTAEVDQAYFTYW